MIVPLPLQLLKLPLPKVDANRRMNAILNSSAWLQNYVFQNETQPHHYLYYLLVGD